MTWMSWQIDYLLWLQSFREATNGMFDQFFLLISNLGIPPFTIVCIIIIYWALNKDLGKYLLCCSFFALYFNVLLKQTFCIYRPWILDSRVQPPEAAFGTAGGFSFPSGHTSGVVSSWGAFGYWFWNNKIIRYVCIAMIFLVMFSRNYLGVHTTQDVIVSLIVGTGVFILVAKIFEWKKEKPGREYIVLGLIGLLCVLLWVYLSIKSYPVDYDANGKLLFDCENERMENLPIAFGVFSVFFGCFLENKFIKFEPEKIGIIRKIILLTFGFYLLHLIDINLREYLDNNLGFLQAHCSYEFVKGFYITFLYPCFIKLTDKIICINKKTD